MEMKLEGKIAIVTGASKGIGLAIVEALAREGVGVVAASREPGEVLVTLAKNYKVLHFPVDLGKKDGPLYLAEYCIKQFGGLDLLFNNVGGVNIHPKGFLSTSDEDWQHSLEVNLMSMVRMTRAGLPHMVEQGSGVIVNISSINVHQPDPLVTEYGAAKSGVTNLSKALSQEFGPKGIRINSISPGPVRTAIQIEAGGVADTLSGPLGIDRETLIKQLPKLNGMVLGRFIEPAEVANLALYLASPLAAMITGADIIIDGGMVKTV